MINRIHLFDLSATYQVTERWSATLSVPIQDADRSSALRDRQRNVVDRTYVDTEGIGDIVLAGRYWLFAPETHKDFNVQLGLGAKFPTGQHDLTDTRKTLTGSERVTVDQSIQPGDGGFGIVFDVSAFHSFTDRWTAYLSGTYLFNPRNKTDTRTGRGRVSEAEMSVADQYVARVGVAFTVVPEWGLGVTLGGRIEGVPKEDLIGKEDGFRRPGYAASIEPGLLWSKSDNTVQISVPVPLYRNRIKSVQDEEDGRHGDAAFADWVFLATYSRKF